VFLLFFYFLNENLVKGISMPGPGPAFYGL
jgi:hypothetical protein